MSSNPYPHYHADASVVPKRDGDGSFAIPVKALNIAWGNDNGRYWIWDQDHSISSPSKSEEGSGFYGEPIAKLHQVNWLEVTGTLELDASTIALPCEYTVFYVVRFSDDAFGWGRADIKFKVKLEGEDGIFEVEKSLQSDSRADIKFKVKLEGEDRIFEEKSLQSYSRADIKSKVKLEGKDRIFEEEKSLQSYREKPGKWHHIPGGRFTIIEQKPVVVAFAMFEVETEFWRGGMDLAGVIVKPKRSYPREVAEI